MSLSFLRSGVLVAAFTAVLAVAAGSSFAQTGKPAKADSKSADKATIAEPAENDHHKKTRAKISAWNWAIERMAERLSNQSILDRELVRISDRAADISASATALIAGLTPSIQAIEARLNKLTPAKSETETVLSEEVKAALEKHLGELARVGGYAKQAQVIILRSGELVDSVNARRRSAFFDGLVQRNRSIINPEIWADAVTELPKLAVTTFSFLNDWWTKFRAHSGGFAILFVVLAIVVAILLSAPVRRIILKRTIRNSGDINPSPRRKTLAAFAIILASTAIPLMALGAPILTLDFLDLTTYRASRFFGIIAMAVTTFFALHGIGRALLAPGRAGWRFLPLDDRSAEKSNTLLTIGALIIAAAIVIDGLLRLLFASLSITVVISGTLTFLVGLTALANLHALTQGIGHERPGISRRDRSFPSLWRWLVPLAWVMALGALIAPLIGYVSLGRYLATQLIWAALTFALLFLFLRLVDEVVTELFRSETGTGRVLINGMGFSGARLQQLGVVLSGLLRLVLFFVALHMLSLPIGLGEASIDDLLRKMFFGIKLGEVLISPSTVLIALLIFIVGFMSTRMFQRWLEYRFLPRTELDVGLKTSIQTAMGYLGILIAAMVAFSYAGFNLENVAIVAGALSVGIGFGLQSIVNNFVSGLILLAERPIKVGDWIVVGAEQGYVRRINVRATEIETFDRATVIIPNSDFISGTVKNWMHKTEIGRITVAIGVSYDSDPEQVRNILFKCIKISDQILEDPEPSIYFVEFGASSLDFEIRCYLRDINYSMSTKSALRFEIFRRFREAGIEIPFPQQDVHLRDIDRIAGPMEKSSNIKPVQEPPESQELPESPDPVSTPGQDSGEGRRPPKQPPPGMPPGDVELD